MNTDILSRKTKLWIMRLTVWSGVLPWIGLLVLLALHFHFQPMGGQAALVFGALLMVLASALAAWRLSNHIMAALKAERSLYAVMKLIEDADAWEAVRVRLGGDQDEWREVTALKVMAADQEDVPFCVESDSEVTKLIVRAMVLAQKGGRP
jgi:hypothetical protein